MQFIPNNPKVRMQESALPLLILENIRIYINKQLNTGKQMQIGCGRR